MKSDFYQEILSVQHSVQQTLAGLSVEVISENGHIKMVASGNNTLKDVWIDDQIFSQMGKAELEILIRDTVNLALEKANKIRESETDRLVETLKPSLGLFPK